MKWSEVKRAGDVYTLNTEQCTKHTAYNCSRLFFAMFVCICRFLCARWNRYLLQHKPRTKQIPDRNEKNVAPTIWCDLITCELNQSINSFTPFLLIYLPFFVICFMPLCFFYSNHCNFLFHSMLVEMYIFYTKLNFVCCECTWRFEIDEKFDNSIWMLFNHIQTGNANYEHCITFSVFVRFLWNDKPNDGEHMMRQYRFRSKQMSLQIAWKTKCNQSITIKLKSKREEYNR